VSTRGGDHLRSEPFIELSDDPEIGKQMFGDPGATMRMADTGKGKLIHYFEDWCAIIDALEPCKNIMQNMMLLEFPRAAYAYTVTTGIAMSAEEIQQAGERITNIERIFGVREGISRKDDTLPRRFRETPLTEGGSAGTVLDLELMLDEYYSSRGWNSTIGHPTPETLRRLSLGFAISDLQ
jgi:aldehyde:ferredoxin oxidoreductase